MSRTNIRTISSSSTIATPTRPNGTASGFEVPLCRCGGPGEDAPGECDGFMDDDKTLECLRRKLMTGRHQPSEKLEQESQGLIFNLCVVGIHALRRLKRRTHVQSLNQIKELFCCAGRTEFPDAQ